MSETYPNAGPNCPQCGGGLRCVPKSKWFNADQWDSMKAGDYFCEKCPDNGRGKTGKCYWWESEVVSRADSPDAEKMVAKSLSEFAASEPRPKPSIERVQRIVGSPTKCTTVGHAPEPTLLEAAERYVAFDSIENFRALKAAVELAKGGG